MDMASGEVFIPVGNPAPDFMPGHRPGENLFTNSVVVLDARTGALKWWHQMAPNDGLDLDIGSAPMLYWNSKGEPMMAAGSKDGHVYGVNRESHERAYMTPITTIEKPSQAPNDQGVRSCPGALGGVEWNGPAWDGKNKQVMVGSVDWCSIVKSAEVKYEPGQFLFGGSYTFEGPRTGWVHALDPDPGPTVAALTDRLGYDANCWVRVRAVASRCSTVGWTTTLARRELPGLVLSVWPRVARVSVEPVESAVRRWVVVCSSTTAPA